MKQRWLNCKKRCAVQNGAGTLAWTYDPFGHITQRTTTVGAHTLVTATTFDAAGRLATLTTPAGHTLTYTWDKDQLTAVSLDGTLLLTDITRAPFGPLDAWRWADGTDTVRLFNRNGEPIAQAVQASVGWAKAVRPCPRGTRTAYFE